MRRLAVAGVVCASCTLTLAFASAQDTTAPDSTAPAAKTSKVTWFGWWPRPGDTPPVLNSGPVVDKKNGSLIPIESPARLREREKQTWLRRNDVVIRLREIATQTGDEELMRKADELQARVFDVYKQRVSQIPGEIAADGPAPIQASFNSAKLPNGTAAPAAEDKR